MPFTTFWLLTSIIALTIVSIRFYLTLKKEKECIENAQPLSKAKTTYLDVLSLVTISVIPGFNVLFIVGMLLWEVLVLTDKPIIKGDVL